jgi:Tfp pilus assembly PilM family ATPase
MMLATMLRRKPATLPLGVDLGQTRVRVALLEVSGDERRLIAVAARDRAASLGDTLREALSDLGSPERRCVLGITEPDGLVRPVTFPPMPSRERSQAARFEADRLVRADEPLVVRLFPLDGNARFAIGIAKRRTIDDRLHVARETRLTCVGVDNAAFAYQRLARQNEAILDIGATAATLYLFGDVLPSTTRFEMGGERLTAGLAESLGIDLVSAEQRKRAYGLAGAATHTLKAFVEAVAGALVGARSRGMRIDHLALVGNGTRLDDLRPALAIATGLSVGRLDTLPLSCETLPPDIVRAEAGDWALAVGLALRGTA